MDTFKNTSMIIELDKIILQKKNLTDTNDVLSNPNKRELLSLINTQLELTRFLKKQSSGRMKFVLRQVAKHFTSEKLDVLNQLGKLDKTQELLLIGSLESDLNKIISDCGFLDNLFKAEIIAIERSYTSEYAELFEKELSLIENLKKILKEDGEFEKNFNNNLNIAKQIDYSAFWSNLKKWALKFAAQHSNKYNKFPCKILEPIGVENIPLTGPVIIAPRHYDINIDPGVLFSVIHRRTFTVVGVDGILDEAKFKSSQKLYKGSGIIPINRPDAESKSPYYPDATPSEVLRKMLFLLRSGEAILIFPEGWASIGLTHGAKKDLDELLPAQNGFIVALELAQKELRRSIPVIPVGLVITPRSKTVEDMKNNSEKRTIQAIIGKPLYLDTSKYNRLERNEIRNLRVTFGEAVMSEIKALSRL